MSDPFTFDPPPDDPLGVLTSTAPVAAQARHVRIVPEAVERFARAYTQKQAPAQAGGGAARAAQGGDSPSPGPEQDLHCTFLPPRQFCNYLLVLEALNFCFWDSEPRWRVTYRGHTYDGYWALAAALRRAIREDGAPVCDPYWLGRIELFQLRQLLRGEGRCRPPPLLEARQIHLREVGRVLAARWEGEFANLVASCGGDAATLAAKIVREFSSFDDVARWRGRPVLLHKRAQICAADLARLMPEGGPQKPAGLERLTAFADYKVPQVLRKEGVLLPAPALAQKIDRGEPLAAGSEEEVEIRAATVWACEWIARALRRAAPPQEAAAAGRQGVAAGGPRTAVEVDQLLWNAGQHKAGLPPYHRTRTVYY